MRFEIPRVTLAVIVDDDRFDPGLLELIEPFFLRPPLSWVVLRRVYLARTACGRG